MSKVYLRVFGAFSAFLVGFLVIQGSGVYAANMQPKVIGCRVMQVTLHGNNAPTNTCLMMTGAKISPATQSSSCISSSVQLFVDINYGRAELCFTGVGYANLTDYQWFETTCDPVTGFCNPVFFSWNDALSSFRTGSWRGYLWWDINKGGPNLFFSALETCPNIGAHINGTNLANWNDRASSIQIIDNFVAGPNVC
jgi:hypothetical protein